MGRLKIEKEEEVRWQLLQKEKDDFSYYLDSWAEAGGIAVKHSQATTDQTIAKLEEIYAPWIGDK